MTIEEKTKIIDYIIEELTWIKPENTEYKLGYAQCVANAIESLGWIEDKEKEKTNE